MSFYKVAVAFVVVALGAAAVLAFPSFSPEVDASLEPSAVKANRVAAPEQTNPEPVKLDQLQPEQLKPEPAKPEVAPEPVPLPQARPKKGRTQQASHPQGKSQQSKPAQAEPRAAAKVKGCTDSTLSYYAAKCQRTRTKVVNGVRTTRIVADDRPTQE